MNHSVDRDNLYLALSGGFTATAYSITQGGPVTHNAPASPKGHWPLHLSRLRYKTCNLKDAIKNTKDAIPISQEATLIAEQELCRIKR